MHEAIPASPACCQGSRSTVSPTLHISATPANHGGPGQAAGRGFEHWISCSRGRLMRHWRRRPARLQRFLRNIKPVSPFVSRPSRWQYVRLLPHLAHVAVKGTSGITPPWERRGPACCWRGSAARTSLPQMADTKFNSPTDFGLCPRSNSQQLVRTHRFLPHPTAGHQPAARRSWLCVVCRSCHPIMTRPPMNPPTPTRI